MFKLISFVRTRPPSFDLGYCDPCTVYDGTLTPIKTFHGRSTPNPVHPKTGQPWDLCYGCIAPGMYVGEFTRDRSGRTCVVLRAGMEVPAILPNPNHDNRHVVTGAEVHCGYREDDPKTKANEAWPGSAACCTIAPSQWNAFCKLFKMHEAVHVEIIAP
jgi:hypothetical protein